MLQASFLPFLDQGERRPGTRVSGLRTSEVVEGRQLEKAEALELALYWTNGQIRDAQAFT